MAKHSLSSNTIFYGVQIDHNESFEAALRVAKKSVQDSLMFVRETSFLWHERLGSASPRPINETIPIKHGITGC